MGDKILMKVFVELCLPNSLTYSPLGDCMANHYNRLSSEHPDLYDIFLQVTDKLEMVFRCHRDAQSVWQQKLLSVRVRVFEYKCEHLFEWIEFNRDVFMNMYLSFGDSFKMAIKNEEDHQQMVTDMIIKSTEYNKILEYATFFMDSSHYSVPKVEIWLDALKRSWKHYGSCLEKRSLVLVQSIKFFQESERFSGCVPALVNAIKNSKLNKSVNIDVAMKSHRNLKDTIMEIYRKFHMTAIDLLHEIDQLIQVCNLSTKEEDATDFKTILDEYEKLVVIILKVIMINVDQNRDLEKLWDEKENELLKGSESKLFSVNIENVLQWIKVYGEPFLAEHTNVGCNFEQANVLLAVHGCFEKIAENTHKNGQNIIDSSAEFIDSGNGHNSNKVLVEELKYRMNMFWESMRYRRLLLENSVIKNYMDHSKVARKSI